MRDEMRKIYTQIYDLMEAGNFEQAITTIINEQTGRLNPIFKIDANHSWYCAGDAYFKIGNYVEAIKAFQRSRKADPQDAICFLALGNSYDALGRFKIAERMFRQALSLRLNEFNRATAFFNLGNALYDQRRYKEAIDIFNKIKNRKDKIGLKTRKNLTLANQYLNKLAK